MVSAKTAYTMVQPKETKAFKFSWVKVSPIQNVVFYSGCVLSGGILPILCINYPTIHMKLVTESCSAKEAEFVFIQEEGQDEHYAEVEHFNIQEGEFACFEAGGLRHVSASSNNWAIERLPTDPENFTERFVCQSDGSLRPNRAYLQAMYGLNRMKIEAADPATVSLKECVSPFYLFQYFAVAVWLYTNYIIYSCIVMCITISSIVFCIRGKLFNLKRLHDLAGLETTITRVDERTGKHLQVSDQTLVPGDCFVLKAGMTIPADAILIKGRVVIDESMLTGESVPVTKTEFKLSTSDSDATKRTANILYSGTQVKVVYQGTEAVAMTYRTGFRSARGELIAALITPKQEVVSFMPEAIMAIVFMVVITTSIFMWSASELKHLDASNEDVIIAYLTALTIAVPPGLVACLSIGTSISVVRLQLKQVTITDTGKLNAAGYVSYACFDKTGTLTDENIVFQGTKLYRDKELQVLTHGISTKSVSSQIANEIMSSCHSLSIMDGKIVGDPLEVELFNTPGWSLKQSADAHHMVSVPPPTQMNAGLEHVILRQFEFSPEKLRAVTLLARPSGKTGGDVDHILLMKGSPEMVISLSSAESLPEHLDAELTVLAKQGFRVLALAYRVCSEPVSTLMAASQTDLESSAPITFLGLVYFSNKLKPDTFPATIQGLQSANIHVNMITGDHFHTAAAIAADCNILHKGAQLYLIDAPRDGKEVTASTAPVIIDPATDDLMSHLTVSGLIKRYNENKAVGNDTTVSPLTRTSRSSSDIEICSKDLSTGFQIVVTGAGFACIQNSCPELLESVCRAASVFARMKPSDKKKVVQTLMASGSHVLFCGDGANDMEALSTATVGVSLCDTATTVAAAIVSTSQSPLAVVDVLKEGRCSLVTAYVLVNFNILYAIIQLFMTCFVNNIGLKLGDYMYLIQDLFYSLFLGLCIANTGPSDTLSVKLPPQSLFTRGLLVKLFLQVAIFPLFQFLTLQALYAQPWFHKIEIDDPFSTSYANESAALNIMCLAQLMIASVVVTIGEPYRKPWYTNKMHLLVLLGHASWIMYLMFGSDDYFMYSIDNKHAPHSFGGVMIGLIAANVVVSAAATKLADMFF